ncbi:hypothetical protein SS50377_26572 [Spironucleus salmonicida]|uniref:Uncharacterized protein n=1 Tax=Spironucleus salmonicida TaxID=348837 RepID=V6LAE5_9EUKA|nr:hypothetical protein SS50377_26572 [Spironucleus salmonicida]|eukprot:EST41425.1 hypothetical protein SS50377_19143 [Spironucleus salmonicida]
MFVLFEQDLQCDVNTDHINPKNVLPIFKKIIDSSESYLLKVPFLKSTHVMDGILQEGFEELNSKVEYYKNQTEQYERLYHSQNQIEEQLQHVLTDITMDKGKEKQKYMSQIQFLLEQLFNKKQTSDRYKPDFGQDTDTQLFTGTIQLTNQNEKMLVEKDEAVRKAVILQRQVLELSQKQEIQFRSISQLEYQLTDYSAMKESYDSLTEKLTEKVADYNQLENQLFDVQTVKKELSEQLIESSKDIKKFEILSKGKDKLNSSKTQKEVQELTQLVETQNITIGELEEKIEETSKNAALFKQKSTTFQTKFEELERKSISIVQQNEQYKLELTNLNVQLTSALASEKPAKISDKSQPNQKQKKQDDIKNKLHQLQEDQKSNALKAQQHIKNVESEAFREITGLKADGNDTCALLLEKFKYSKNGQNQEINSEVPSEKTEISVPEANNSENESNLRDEQNAIQNDEKTPISKPSKNLKKSVSKSKEKVQKPLKNAELKQKFVSLLEGFPQEIQDEVNFLLGQMDEKFEAYQFAQKQLEVAKKEQKLTETKLKNEIQQLKNQIMQDNKQQINGQEIEFSNNHQKVIDVQEGLISDLNIGTTKELSTNNYNDKCNSNNNIYIDNMNSHTDSNNQNNAYDENFSNDRNLMHANIRDCAEQGNQTQQDILITPTESPTRKLLFRIKDQIEAENAKFVNIQTSNQLSEEEIQQIMQKQQGLVSNFNDTLKQLAHQDLQIIDQVESEIKRFLLQQDKQTQCQQIKGDQEVNFTSDLPALVNSNILKSSNGILVDKIKPEKLSVNGTRTSITQGHTQRITNTPKLTSNDLIATPATIICPHCQSNVQFTGISNTEENDQNIQGSNINQSDLNFEAIEAGNSDTERPSVSDFYNSNTKKSKNILFNTKVSNDQKDNQIPLARPSEQNINQGVQRRTLKQVAQLYDSVTVGYDATGKEVFIPKPSKDIDQKLKIVNKILLPLGINPVETDNSALVLQQLQKKRDEIKKIYDKSYMRYNHQEVLKTLKGHERGLKGMMVVTDKVTRHFYSLVGMSLVRTINTNQTNFRRGPVGQTQKFGSQRPGAKSNFQ